MTISAAIGSLAFKPGVCTSATRPASPYEGQLIYETDTDSVAFWDGSYWRYLEARRNLLYNGAMQVAQRGTSTTGITSSGYYTADRWAFVPNAMGTWTQTVENDAPTGSGFRKSLKLACTTIDASPAAGDYVLFDQYLEGQDLQEIRKGTSSAQQLTLSFWVKSFQTGTFVVELFDNDNSRQISKSYTINASGTWEFKTLTYPADTTGAFDNDNASSLTIRHWLGAGTTYTSGTLNSSAWASSTNANRAAGIANLASSTNNYWQITGVQLNVGAVAAPFEFKSYQQELRECQRYYQRQKGTEVNDVFAVGWLDPYPAGFYYFKFISPMRTDSPTVTFSAASTFNDGNYSGAAACTAIVYYSSNEHTARLSTNHTGVPNVANQPVFLLAATTAAYIASEAEL